jgi:DNA mismatch repair protein MutS2
MKAREQELDREKSHLATEGRKEQQAKIREMENKLEALFRDFEYHARETVNAVQDRAAAAEIIQRRRAPHRQNAPRISRAVRRHRRGPRTGADRGDPNAQPSLVKHVSEGDTVKLKSMGRAAVVKKKIGDHHFDVEIGSMKMRINREDIAEVLSSPGKRPPQANPP